MLHANATLEGPQYVVINMHHVKALRYRTRSLHVRNPGHARHLFFIKYGRTSNLLNGRHVSDCPRKESILAATTLRIA